MAKKDNSDGVTAFEEKHMISMLMFLGANGPSRKIDIYEGVSSNPRMPDKLNHLEEIGLSRWRWTWSPVPRSSPSRRRVNRLPASSWP